MLRIEPVGPADQPRALRLLVGGRSGAHGRVAAFEELLSGPKGPECSLWWARTLRGPRSAALAVPSTGRYAMVFHSPPTRGRRGVQVLSRLLAKVAESSLGGGMVFAQALVPPEDTLSGQAIVQAGYQRLAELIYMHRRLAKLPEQSAPLRWDTFPPGQEQRLGQIIADTYTDSQDCPALLGRRAMDDVIASHKASGVFHPESWWLPTHQGQTVGCVLVNDGAARQNACELVYLGTRPAWRRRGFARAMLRHAMAVSAGRGFSQMSLAVDSTNIPAVGLYQHEGFVELDRRVVYIALPE